MNGTQQELFNAELVREHRWDWCMLKAIATMAVVTIELLMLKWCPHNYQIEMLKLFTLRLTELRLIHLAIERFATRGHADESIAQAVANHLNTCALGQGKFYCIKAILLRKVVRPEPSTLQRVEFAAEGTGIGTGFTPCMFEVEID